MRFEESGPNGRHHKPERPGKKVVAGVQPGAEPGQLRRQPDGGIHMFVRRAAGRELSIVANQAQLWAC